MAVFTRPAWLINSPLQGLFINCLCLFHNEYAIFRAGHFHNTCIFPEHHLFCFVEEFWFVFHFLLQLGCSLPIHFVARSVLTDLEAAAGPTERTGEINLSLF